MTNKASKEDFAGFWVRVASVCVDVFLISCLAVVAVAVVSPIFHKVMSNGSFLKFITFYLIAVSIIITVLYFAWFNALERQSPGKKLFGIMVLDDTLLQGISFSHSLKRSFNT